MTVKIPLPFNRCFTSGQTDLDPPAEELAGSDAMRRQTAATRNARLFLLLHHRPLLLVGEPLTVRPPVRSLRCQAILTARAMSSAAQLRLGTAMKRGTPVHFVAVAFQAIASNAQRMGERPALRHARHAHSAAKSQPRSLSPRSRSHNRKLLAEAPVASPEWQASFQERWPLLPKRGNWKCARRGRLALRHHPGGPASGSALE